METFPFLAICQSKLAVYWTQLFLEEIFFFFFWNLIFTVFMWHEYSKGKIILSLIRETRNNCSHRFSPALVASLLSRASQVRARYLSCWLQTKYSRTFLAPSINQGRPRPSQETVLKIKLKVERQTSNLNTRKNLLLSILTSEPLTSVCHWIQGYKRGNQGSFPRLWYIQLLACWVSGLTTILIKLDTLSKLFK